MDIQSYGNAIQKVVPGTFVPDIAPQPPAPAAHPLTGAAPGETAATSFKDTVKSLLEGVNDKMVTAGAQEVALATGRSNNLDGTIRSVEEAGLAFQFTEAIRNKLMDAYTEIQQMQF